MRDNVAYPIGRAVLYTAEHIDRMVRERYRYVAAMNELGWPPTILTDFATQQLVLTTLGQRKPRDAAMDIESALVNHFDEARLKALLANWLEYELAAERRAILTQIVHAHSQGLHGLVVPVVHAQIDGLLSTAFRLQGKATDVPWKRLSKVLEGSPFPNSAHHVANRFLQSRVRVPFERGRPLRSDHSRHAIAHGHDLSYGTPQNSLKAILLLDYVIWAIKDLRLVEDGVYHRPTCISITARFDELGFVRNPLDLIMQRQKRDLRPCLACAADYLQTEPRLLPATTRRTAQAIHAFVTTSDKS